MCNYASRSRIVLPEMPTLNHVADPIMPHRPTPLRHGGADRVVRKTAWTRPRQQQTR